MNMYTYLLMVKGQHRPIPTVANVGGMKDLWCSSTVLLLYISTDTNEC